jgi:hypothetical protein
VLFQSFPVPVEALHCDNAQWQTYSVEKTNNQRVCHKVLAQRQVSKEGVLIVTVQEAMPEEQQCKDGEDLRKVL